MAELLELEVSQGQFPAECCSVRRARAGGFVCLMLKFAIAEKCALELHVQVMMELEESGGWRARQARKFYARYLWSSKVRKFRYEVLVYVQSVSDSSLLPRP